MHDRIEPRGIAPRIVTAVLLFVGGVATASDNFGPYNATFLAGGVGMELPLAADTPTVKAGSAWSLSGWLRSERITKGRAIVAAVGDVSPGGCRCLMLDDGGIALQLDAGRLLQSRAALQSGSWHAVAATYDGHVARLYVDGTEADSRTVATAAVSPSLHLAPEDSADLTGQHHFGGSVASFQLYGRALAAAEIAAFNTTRPNFALLAFHQVGVGWPLQERAWRGLLEPQPAWTLPRGTAVASPPVRDMAAVKTTSLEARGPDLWVVGDWRLTTEPLVGASGEVQDWYPAVVPGTVLTTLIANGVYPDPDYGLNNLAIPESLNRQAYWYRTSFVGPAQLQGRRLTLIFKGINYAADVWLNGVRIGDIRGAFVRGIFDVTQALRVGSENVLAVRVSPPPHPGIPHEQSVAAGPGENGGQLALDGPTFIATEGWDWIPAIRDRNTGIWQDVALSASGLVRVGDPQIVTTLPLPRTDSADIAIGVPLDNNGHEPTRATVGVDIEGTHVSKTAQLPPGITEVRFDPTEYPQLRFMHPRLWWPNGYGEPNLYTARISVRVGATQSDSKVVRFGMRELTYELSLFDREGKLRRVEVDPSQGSARHERLVDSNHDAIKRTANGWAASLTAAGETSPAVRDIDTTSLTPYLVIRVNGVRIAARGGSWGMDDSRKRVGRERLQPYFQLQRNAHLNIMRNWLGQDTEEVFYDLADEYGLLVLNDFWESTENFQLEAQDPQLFLRNARDVILRYRNHPSIAVWFGRNEGVPQPILNEGLADAVALLDGTRYYTGSSNSVNLQGSGPYNWRPPEGYFTTLAQGFSVEVGTPSLASIESLRASIPAADLWPPGDTYAYHDWHFGGNGDTASYMQALRSSLGAATDLEDFERKAQLMNYVSYRAIFEGFQAHVWTRNSGRLLWMSHPSWPSNTWQIYTSDYDTPAAYYAVSKACEPVHAQLNLPDFERAVVNLTRAARQGLQLRTRIVALDNRMLYEDNRTVDAPANGLATFGTPELRPILERNGVVLVELVLKDSGGAVLSNNLYWESHQDADLVRLTKLPQVALEVSALAQVSGQKGVVSVTLRNRTQTPALLAKLTLLDSTGQRVLPVYYQDNYVSLLPGETRDIEVTCPAGGRTCASVAVRGWNIKSESVAVD